MHIILGGTGHVGSAATLALLGRGERVTVVTRSAAKATHLQAKGADVAVADVRDTDALRLVLKKGRRLYIINPPAPPSTDTDLEESENIHSILAALGGSGLEKIVAHSTYGATKGKSIGDLGTLFELEEGLGRQPIPFSVLRAAYYMTNWEMSLEAVEQSGVLATMFPSDLVMPMVAPQDLGEVAADLMTEPAQKTQLVHVEGPDRYSPADVAGVLSKRFNRAVRVATVAQDQWQDTFRDLGFSPKAATSYAGMTALALNTQMPPLDTIRRGKVTLQQFFAGSD